MSPALIPALNPALNPALLWRSVLTLAIGYAAARACVALGTPLPWMIGPLVASAVLCMAGAGLRAPRAMRNAGQWVIGASLGLYFTAPVLAAIARLAPAIVLAVAWALGLGYLAYRFLWRQARAVPGLDRATAFFAGAIGGASEMAVLAERNGGRVDLVAAAHSLRVVLVVVTVPFVLQGLDVHGADLAVPGPRVVDAGGLALLVLSTGVGIAVAHRLGVPNPFALGALAVSLAWTVAGFEWSAVPRPVLEAGQPFIGLALGTRFQPAFWHAAPRWLLAVTLMTVAMLLASAAFAGALAVVLDLHPATLALATSPGGMAEMSLTAKVLGLGVPVVTAFHTVRYVAVLVLTPWLWSREQRAQPTARA